MLSREDFQLFLTCSLRIIRLPGLIGTQVAAEMKRQKRAIPIALFSGLVEVPLGSDHAEPVITKGMPAVDFLRKLQITSKMTISEEHTLERCLRVS
jgi:FixJ family two-component response regulator